jgi:hypothetical protein
MFVILVGNLSPILQVKLHALTLALMKVLWGNICLVCSLPTVASSYYLNTDKFCQKYKNYTALFIIPVCFHENKDISILIIQILSCVPSLSFFMQPFWNQ